MPLVCGGERDATLNGGTKSKGTCADAGALPCIEERLRKATAPLSQLQQLNVSVEQLERKLGVATAAREAAEQELAAKTQTAQFRSCESVGLGLASGRRTGRSPSASGLCVK